ncbi:MAG: UDP-N-acetylmuramoyl-L-alanine--D-glutamate ligase [Candidatus Saccharibacteria bacterium]|nr:UDP-N-acetylmuramoyl-L-alanine--D-glutamate ligase [Candidatus Saccharibacteria bacterium]
MKIAILGYGQEGHSVETYFKNDEITVFDKFSPEDIPTFQLENFDLVFRSPSVHPHPEIPAHWTSSTRYFFDHCPCDIIGITGTKGKGTTCTLLKSLLDAFGKTTHLVGNIGLPCLDELDKIKKDDIVIFELSSFQLWDLEKSPRFAALLRLEPDHLDVHDSFTQYLEAKSHITSYQSANDYLIYYAKNENTNSLAKNSPAKKFSYPFGAPKDLLSHLHAPGDHNKENAEAALLLANCYISPDLSIDDFIKKYSDVLIKGLEAFHSLPHHIEFVRTLNGVDYYDDSYSTTFPSVDVALKTFADHPLILIAGGKDKGIDYDILSERIFTSENLEKCILIGETKHKFARKAIDESQYKFAETFPEAIENAQYFAEQLAKQNANISEENYWQNREQSDLKNPVVLLSPGAASFDMFTSYSARGDEFKSLVNSLA